MPCTIIHKPTRPNRLAADLESLRLAGCGIRWEGKDRQIRSISRQYARMARALRVIHTWATVDEMDAAGVQDLTAEALRRFR